MAFIFILFRNEVKAEKFNKKSQCMYDHRDTNFKIQRKVLKTQLKVFGTEKRKMTIFKNNALLQ